MIQRVVRDIQKICTRHHESVLEPGSVLTGIMQSECRLCVFKGALNTVDGPKTTLCTGHKHSPRAETPPPRCHPRKKRSSVRLPFVLEEVSGQGSPCESLTAKTPSTKVKGSVACTTNEDSRQKSADSVTGLRHSQSFQRTRVQPRGQDAGTVWQRELLRPSAPRPCDL